MERRAPREPELRCQGWQQEGILRLLLNTIDPQVAQNPDELIVYGSARAVRSHSALEALVAALQDLRDDETLVVQSGKPVAVFPTHEMAPRVIMSTAMLVPKWADWATFWLLAERGLTMYGQSTAGCWAYVGTQGILQGTFATFAEVARRHFGGSLAGRTVLTAGLGAMGRAQPVAVTMNGGVCLAVDADARRLKALLDRSDLDLVAADLDEALTRVGEAARARVPRAVGLCANAAEVYPELVRRSFIPDVVTDQTAAHDPLNGYIPAGLSPAEARRLRRGDPQEYVRRSLASMVTEVQAMLDLARQGAVVFDYGNNIRGQAERAGVEGAFQIPGFVQAYIRPLLAEGRGPFRWVALSGDPGDIFHLDSLLLRELPPDSPEERWVRYAQERLWFQGLPARVLWLDFAQRLRFGELANAEAAAGRLRAPIAITRDHLDAGAMASPHRETEGMPDGSDPVADWPVLNALLNCASGATLVSLQQGGGVGIGYSIHAGMTIIADGRAGTERRLARVLTGDVGLGLVRLYDAGYGQAGAVAGQGDFRLLTQGPGTGGGTGGAAGGGTGGAAGGGTGGAAGGGTGGTAGDGRV